MSKGFEITQNHYSHPKFSGEYFSAEALTTNSSLFSYSFAILKIQYIKTANLSSN
jgi:hypothetical protein